MFIMKIEQASFEIPFNSGSKNFTLGITRKIYIFITIKSGKAFFTPFTRDI